MDHETSGAQEWQLPGYGRASSKPRNLKSRQIPSQPRASMPKGPVRKDTNLQRQSSQGATTQYPSVPSSAPPTRGSFRGARGRGGFARAQSRAATPRNQSRFFKDSPAKSKWRAGKQATGAVKLPSSFGHFKYEFFGAARSSAAGRKTQATQGRFEVFEDISRKTGAFVKPPGYTDQAIYLWGEPAQVTAARDLIQNLIAKCNTSSSKKKIEWNKISAYSSNKEADIDLKERRETLLQQLKKAPEVPSAFPEQLLFLWPRDGPSLTDSLGLQLEALDVFRAKFGCHMFVPKELPDYICVLGQSYETMRQIAHLLRTKWSEIVANSNVKTKAYVVDPPNLGLMGNVVVKNNKQFAKAFLQTGLWVGAESENWRNRSALINSKNNARLLSAVEKSLKGVAFVRGHLRMRVNIGSFVLDEYRLPKDDRASYDFEEFREMLLHEQTKGRLIPGLRIGHEEFLSRCFKATKLLEPYESISRSLEDAKPSFSVNFEFLGANNALLRLEAEFSKSPGAQEYEITQRRWLRPRKSGQSSDSRSPLQVAVLDFERSDWQVEIKSLEFYETSSIDTALKSFSHSIGFRRTDTINDISAKPERKVIFPSTAPVSRFIEKTAIRYRIKGTKYIFEIARYDEYSRTCVPAFAGQNPPTITGQISDVPSTSWGASIFDPNWDNLLGQHANLPVGHSARYNPNLDTFFPPKKQSVSDDACAGFWEFIDLVKQAAELLGPAPVPLAGKSQEAAGKKQTGPLPLTIIANALRNQSGSKSTSATVDIKDLSGLLDADLGTLF